MNSAARLLIAMARQDSLDRTRGVIIRAAAVRAERLPIWWQWSTWLAAAITIQRIERA